MVREALRRIYRAQAVDEAAVQAAQYLDQLGRTSRNLAWAMPEASRRWRAALPDDALAIVDGPEPFGADGWQGTQLSATPSEIVMPEWQGDEPWESALDLLALHVTVRRSKPRGRYVVELAVRYLAVMSVHALARRLQRGGGGAPAAVLEALHAVRGLDGPALEIPTPTGRYLARMIAMDTPHGRAHLPALRTWLAS